MAKFFGERTCTLHMTEYFPDTYNEITHSTLASMLQEEDYLQETYTIQISTGHKYASICFTQKDIPEKLCETEHQLIDTYVKFKPDYHTRIRMSIEQVPIKLPGKEVKTLLPEYTTATGKIYYPGIKHENKYFTTGTRVYQYIKITTTYSKTHI